MKDLEIQLTKLAQRFFEGTITYEQEQILFDILQQNAEAYNLFCTLEKTWIQQHHTSAKVEQQWQRFVTSINQPENTAIYRINKLQNVKKIAAAIVLIVASVVTTYLFTTYHNTIPDTYYTCVAPLGGKAEVILPDGTHVWLNAGSNLRYSSAFNHKNRQVQLIGEAYFDVTKNTNAKFTVKTNAYNVVVHGTKFNVSAYANDSTATTTLLQGRVQVNKGNKQIMMEPGEKLTLNKHTGKILKVKTTNKANAWIMGNTEYDNITLGELTKILSRRYDVNIVIQSDKLRNERFAISLQNNEDLEGIIRGLQNIIPIHITKQGRNILISQ